MDIKKVLYFIEQSGVLMQMPRSHKRLLGTAFDNVASHSYHVAVISYCICRMEGLSHAESLNAIAMSIFHDVSEARTGDLGYVEKHYNETDNDKAVKEQTSGIEFSEDVNNVLSEYEKRDSVVSKCVKDADSLAQMFQEWVLAWQGNKLADIWFQSDFNDRVPGFYTESAKNLAFAMKDSNPQEWWWSQFIKNNKASDTEKLIGKK